MSGHENGTSAITAQYEAPPAPGLRRFWVSVTSWLPDWPEAVPFYFWHTSSNGQYRLNPSLVGTSEVAGLPLEAHLWQTMPPEWRARFDADEGLWDRMYTSGGGVCALIDAPDGAAAMATMKTHFTDGEDRFCEERPHDTLISLSAGGRFGHPDPHPAAA